MKKSFFRVAAVFMTILTVAGILYGCGGDKGPNEGIETVTDKEGITYLAIVDENDGHTLAGVTDKDGNIYAAEIDSEGNVLSDGTLYPVEYTGEMPTNDTTAVSIEESQTGEYYFGDKDVVTQSSTEAVATTASGGNDTTAATTAPGNDTTAATTAPGNDTTAATMAPGNDTTAATTASGNDTTAATTAASGNDTTAATTASGNDTTVATTAASGDTTAATTAASGNDTTAATTASGNDTTAASTVASGDTTAATTQASQTYMAEKYKTLFQSQTYYVEFYTDDDDLAPYPVTMAIKNGNIYMKTKFEGMDCTMLYQKKKDNVYVVLSDYHVYCKVPSDMLDDFDVSEFGDSEDYTKVDVSNVYIGDKACVSEAYTLTDGSVSTYYFYNGELVRLDQISADGETSILNITKISSTVEDSLFDLPKGYIPVNLSKFDFGGDTTESGN